MACPPLCGAVAGRPRLRRVVCVCSEPLGQRVAGIGLRYVQLAAHLADAGFEVTLLSPGATGSSLGAERSSSSLVPRDAEGFRSLEFDPRGLVEHLSAADVVVGQGQLMNDVALSGVDTPVVVDLFDPWLVENFHYLASLGLDPYRNDHASWVLQLSRGDFFLCSSEEQRLYYLGFLSALGRVHPRRIERDPDLRALIDVVPFGLPLETPPYRPWLPERVSGERRVLFGGVYDWYDPWTLLDAIERLDRPRWKVLFIRNPHRDTPQGLLSRVERSVARRPALESRVAFLEWVPFERRYDLLRDVDLLVAPHATTLESRLSMRTRFLDALLAGCPTIATELGGVARLLREHQAGWVVPVGEPDALGAAMVEAIEGSQREARVTRGRELARELSWQAAVAPLVQFCTNPERDVDRETFAFRPSTHAPPDALLFRVRRRLRRWLGART